MALQKIKVVVVVVRGRYQSLVVNQDELCDQEESLRLYLLHKLKVGRSGMSNC